MSNDATKEEVPSNEEKAVMSPENQDWFLALLVSMVNKTGIGPNVTLFVGGLMISGQLISGRQYIEQFATDWDAAMSRGLGEEPTGLFAAPFMRIAEQFYSRPEIPNEEELEQGETEPEERQPDPRLIHLQNAHIWTSGRNPIHNTEHGIFWRGRLSAVDGFFLGEFAPN